MLLRKQKGGCHFRCGFLMTLFRYATRWRLLFDWWTFQANGKKVHSKLDQATALVSHIQMSINFTRCEPMQCCTIPHILVPTRILTSLLYSFVPPLDIYMSIGCSTFVEIGCSLTQTVYTYQPASATTTTTKLSLVLTWTV